MQTDTRSLHTGPLSEMGEATDAAGDDVQSVYAEGDSDLVSSEGLNHVSGVQADHALPLPSPCCDTVCHKAQPVKPGMRAHLKGGVAWVALSQPKQECGSGGEGAVLTKASAVHLCGRWTAAAMKGRLGWPWRKAQWRTRTLRSTSSRRQL